MNVLLTCAGRRNYMIQYFREALNGRGKVYAADTNADAAALQDADAYFLVPPVNHEDYFDILKNICGDHQIRLLVSLNDLELPLLARERERFLEVGTIVVVSPPNLIDMCFDKNESDKFILAQGLEVPKTYSSLQDARDALDCGDIAFPLVIKPRWGTASIGIDYAQDIEELELMYALTKKRISRTILADISMLDFDRSILIQEFIDGEEFNLDIVNDLNGDYVATLVTHKLALRSGETDRAVTVDNDMMEALGALLGKKLGHIGILDCDIIIGNGVTYILDFNPRFGGAYPFSHVAGANIPAALIAWANGDEPEADWFKIKPNIMASKYDRLMLKDLSEARAETLSLAAVSAEIEPSKTIKNKGLTTGKSEF